VDELIDPTLGFLVIHDLAGPCIPPLLPRISLGGMETSLLDPSLLSLGPFRRIIFKSRALDFEPAGFEEDVPLTVLYLGRGSGRLTELGGEFGRGLLGGRLGLQANVDYREVSPFNTFTLDYQHSYSASVRYHDEPWLLSGFVLAADRDHPDLNLKNNYLTTLFVASAHDYSLALGYGRDRGTYPFEEVMAHAGADIGPLTATIKGRRIWANDLKDGRGSIEVSGWFDLGDIKVRPAVHYDHSEMFDGGPGASITLKGFRSRIDAFYGKRFPQLTMLANDAERWVLPNGDIYEETAFIVDATFGIDLPLFLRVGYLETWNLIEWTWTETYQPLGGTSTLFEVAPGVSLRCPLGMRIVGTYVIRFSEDLEHVSFIDPDRISSWFRDSDGRLKIEETIPLKSGDVLLTLRGEFLYFGTTDFADPQSLLNAGASLNFFESVKVSFELWNLTDVEVYTNELYPLSTRRYTVRVSVRLWD
jgi:hypothetical protein